MSQDGKSSWIGKSGNVYEFYDYTLDTVFVKDIVGNYIFSKNIIDGGREKLYPIYIGEGVIKDRIEFRINEGKVLEKGCDYVSVRLLEKEENSKQIEEDLLAAYPTAYDPIGCNLKKGG